VAWDEIGAVPTDVPMIEETFDEDGLDSEETGQAVWPERRTPEDTHGIEGAAEPDEVGAVTDVPMMELADDPGAVGAGALEPGTDEPGAVEAGADEVGAVTDVPMMELADDPGALEAGALEAGIDEAGALEAGTDEPGALEAGTDEPGISVAVTGQMVVETGIMTVVKAVDLAGQSVIEAAQEMMVETEVA
jgi:hypothetical protein